MSATLQCTKYVYIRIILNSYKCVFVIGANRLFHDNLKFIILVNFIDFGTEETQSVDNVWYNMQIMYSPPVIYCLNRRGWFIRGCCPKSKWSMIVSTSQIQRMSCDTFTAPIYRTPLKLNWNRHLQSRYSNLNSSAYFYTYAVTSWIFGLVS